MSSREERVRPWFNLGAVLVGLFLVCGCGSETAPPAEEVAGADSTQKAEASPPATLVVYTIADV